MSDFADENLYNKEDKNSIVYENFPKVSLYRMPDVKKMRFFASNMLTWQRYTRSWYKGQVRRVTEIRKLLREELDFKTTMVNNS